MTVAKATRQLGLRGICLRRWRTTTVVDHADACPVDAAKRTWGTGFLNLIWVGDITYRRTWQGRLYMATVIDAHLRGVIYMLEDRGGDTQSKLRTATNLSSLLLG